MRSRSFQISHQLVSVHDTLHGCLGFAVNISAQTSSQ
jgi:hypothetical protein